MQRRLEKGFTPSLCFFVLLKDDLLDFNPLCSCPHKCPVFILNIWICISPKRYVNNNQQSAVLDVPPNTVLSSVAIFNTLVFTATYDYGSSCSGVATLAEMDYMLVDGRTVQTTRATWNHTGDQGPQRYGTSYRLLDVTVDIQTSIHTVGVVL